MLVGYGAMFLYTVLMLGRLSMLELRLFLSLAGILSVFLGLVVSVSLASVLSFPYTTIHAVLPFLCLGSYRIYQKYSSKHLGEICPCKEFGKCRYDFVFQPSV